MDERNIRKYAELMKELGLTGLEIKENGSVVRLERTGAAGKTAAATPEAAAEVSEPERAQSGFAEVRSPMVGVFYSSPAENAGPFVRAGDTVRKGDVLCIIEAMKLMNELLAEEDGVVAEVCAENGETVDFGRVLFRLRKED